MTVVANRFPTLSSSRRIACIGESPGELETKIGRPFVGPSGKFLAALLSRAGIPLEACFLGNSCQHRPPGNDITRFSWTGLEIQHGLTELAKDLETFKPNIVVLLGGAALRAAKEPDNAVWKRVNFKISQWRGSLFAASEPSIFAGMKCIATYSPDYVLKKDYEVAPLLQFDLKKAVRESLTPELKLPNRTLETSYTTEQIIQELQGIRRWKTPVAIDIEGGIDSMSCISFALASNAAFIIPFTRLDGSDAGIDTPELWRELALTLEDPNVPKILQNSLYDRFVLHYSYGIRVAGVQHDTMLKHWELYSELEKSLGVQTSLYTSECYYKSDRKSDDDKVFYEYCCRDSAVTWEISSVLDGLLKGTSLEHYRLNISLLSALLYMELRGIRYDVAGAASRRADLQVKMFEAQAKLNALTEHGFEFSSTDEIVSRAKTVMWTAKGDRLRKESETDWARLYVLLADPSPTAATVGEIENLCSVSLNVESSKQMQEYLYEKLKLPVQHKAAKRGEEPKVSTDYEALLKLSRHCLQTRRDADKHDIIAAIIEIRSLATREGMLAISADKDGRIRCGYNIVGSNTGRITCYESPTGSGYNLQTIPNYTSVNEAPGGLLGDRDLFCADIGFWFFQCDLSGADGWTVAAYSAMLGDPTMLDDYRAGISPFKILTLMLRGITIPQDRLALREAVNVVGKDDWDRFACKRVQHGGCYLEGGLTISRNILKDSEGKLYMTPTECEKLKDFFFQRYPGVRRWHDWVARRIDPRHNPNPVLTAASGQVRIFFGRPEEILTKAVAFEPQANTTYATNLAMFRLWSDPENRTPNTDDGVRGTLFSMSGKVLGENGRSNSQLRIEPLHQVHDALCGQFPKANTTWAVGKIKSWFNNPLTIAGQAIVIPQDGNYGPGWGGKTVGKI